MNDSLKLFPICYVDQNGKNKAYIMASTYPQALRLLNTVTACQLDNQQAFIRKYWKAIGVLSLYTGIISKRELSFSFIEALVRVFFTSERIDMEQATLALVYENLETIVYRKLYGKFNDRD